MYQEKICSPKPSYLLWIMLRLYMNLSLENLSVLRHSDVLSLFQVRHTALFLVPLKCQKSLVLLISLLYFSVSIVTFL